MQRLSTEVVLDLSTWGKKEPNRRVKLTTASRRLRRSDLVPIQGCRDALLSLFFLGGGGQSGVKKKKKKPLCTRDIIAVSHVYASPQGVHLTLHHCMWRWGGGFKKNQV